MNDMKTTRDLHKRILLLVAAEDWCGFNSSDEGLLDSMLVTGHLAFATGDGGDSRIRLRITPHGWRYLSHLSDKQ